MANRSSQLIIILAAVLLAVIAGSGLVLWFLGSNEPSPTTLTPTPEVAAPQQPGDDAFNTGVLRSSDYTKLDQQLVTDGSLPVQPPATVGKANPFL